MMHRLVLAALLTAGMPALAAEAPPAPNRFAATLAPAERFEVGSMLVERHGQRGRALILIPGLASGSWAWQDTVRQFMGEYSVYVVTLPGFDGRAPAAGKPLENARQAVMQLIAARKLVKPVLIGHSLGATMSLALAAQHPDKIGGVVALDGLPVFPGSEQLTQAQRVSMAGSMKARMAPANPAMFALQQQQYMRSVGVTDMARADELAKLSGKSDPGAVMDYMAETFTLDLRAELPKITAPVLLIAPYFEEDDSQHQLTESAKRAYYASLMEGTPKVEVVTVSPARHFAMFDQPQKVADAIRAYLKAL